MTDGTQDPRYYELLKAIELERANMRQLLKSNEELAKEFVRTKDDVWWEVIIENKSAIITKRNRIKEYENELEAMGIPVPCKHDEEPSTNPLIPGLELVQPMIPAMEYEEESKDYGDEDEEESWEADFDSFELGFASFPRDPVDGIAYGTWDSDVEDASFEEKWYMD